MAKTPTPADAPAQTPAAIVAVPAATPAPAPASAPLPAAGATLTVPGSAALPVLAHLPTGDRVEIDYVVENQADAGTHMSAKLGRLSALKPGDPGYIGSSRQIHFGSADPAVIAEFQPGRVVRVTIEVLKDPAGGSNGYAQIPVAQVPKIVHRRRRRH